MMGLITQYATLLRYAAVALVVAAAFFWHMHAVSQAEAQGREDGRTEERAQWLHREDHELREANQKLVELQEKYRKLEQKSAADVAAAAARHQKEAHELQTRLDKALADARAGMAFRLRWAASCAPTRKDAGGDPTAEPGSTAAPAGAAAACELPEQARDDLIREAARADRLTIDYNALLEIAKKDREVCR